MNKTKVSQYIQDNFLQQMEQYSITSMCLGEKHKNNKPTGELAVVYTVKNKKSKSNLDSDKIIPAAIQLGDENVITDVVEQDIDYHFESDLCHNINDENDMALINKNRKLNRFGGEAEPLRRSGLSLQNLTYSIEYKNIT